MKRKHRLSLLILMLLMFGVAHAQRIDSLLLIYNTAVPQEKVYIHFDNTLYAPGQTVWYKAYLLNGIEPSAISKNLYIDWFDTNGKLLKRLIAPVMNSCAAGSFTLPEKYAGDHLQVLAYTKWMLNFDSSFLFHHTLAVAQLNVGSTSQAAVIPVTSLRFFPEGGDIIDGLQSTIAFKATLSGGLPVAISGVINNSKGETVTSFTTAHNGMGKFSFIPSPGEVYTAVWQDAKGAVQYTKLPKAKTTGIRFSMGQRNGKWFFSLERPADTERFKKVSIIASMHQQLIFSANVNLSSKNFITAGLPVDQFPSGIMRVTIMDIDHQPLAERVIFVNNYEYLAPASVQIDTLNLDKGGKNIFEIQWPDTTTSSLSLSVTEGLYDSSSNIVSGLLLSSEIKGYVHDPAYYFSSKEDSLAGQLDLVMMTNGWRRFAWEDVMAGKIPALPYARDSGYLSIAGKIDNISESRTKKAEQVNLILVAKDSSKQLLFTPLRPDGSFGEDNLVLFDTVKIFYQFNKSFIPTRSNVVIKSNFLTSDTTRHITPIENYLPDTTGMMRLLSIVAEQHKLDSLMLQTTLKEVVVKTRVKSKLEEMDEKYASGLFKGDSRQFNLVDDASAVSSQNIFAYLASKVAGLTIHNMYSTNPTASWRQLPVSYFMNEMSVDASTIASVSPNDIAYVKVFTPPFFGARGGAGGAIAIYLKHGDEMVSAGKGLEYTLLAGYSPVKQFYVPAPGETKATFPQADLRRTLYWNPNILLDGTHKKARISFYNNDISHTLQIIMEGITEDGRLVHYSKSIK